MTRNNGLAEQYADEARQWEDAIRAASRPATEVVDREAVARAVADRPWEEDYPHGSIGAFNAKDRKERDLAKADRILSLLRPTEPVDAEHPALEWSLSDDAKRRLSEIDENIRHAAIASHSMKVGGIQPTTDAVGEPVAYRYEYRSFTMTSRSLEDDWLLAFSIDKPIKTESVYAGEIRNVQPLYTHPPKSPDTSAAVLAVEREAQQ